MSESFCNALVRNLRSSVSPGSSGERMKAEIPREGRLGRGWGFGNTGIHTRAHATRGLAGRFSFLVVDFLVSFLFWISPTDGLGRALLVLGYQVVSYEDQCLLTYLPIYLPTYPFIYLLASSACVLSVGGGVFCVCCRVQGWPWGWGWEGRSIPPRGSSWRGRRCIWEGVCSLSSRSIYVAWFSPLWMIYLGVLFSCWLGLVGLGVCMCGVGCGWGLAGPGRDVDAGVAYKV